MARPPSAALRRPRAQRRKPKYSARPFVITLLLLSALAAASFLVDSRKSPTAAGASSLLRRDAALEDQECRLVHHAADKCAFVRANCPDEEAGIFSYLQLYYCHLRHAKPVAFTILVLWLALLFSTIGIAASDFFCVNLSTIANLLGMSESMAGVTFLAFGNGSPDVFSTFAAMKTNSGSLAIGELIGAAGFITAVVAGSMALVRPFKVDKRSFVRDVGFFIVAAAFSMVFLVDGKLNLWECVTMVGFYVFYVVFVVWWHWWHGRRQRKRMVEATARGHFVVPGGEEAEVFEPYHDDDDSSVGRPSMSRGESVDDLIALEQSGEYDEPGLETADEEVRERWLGELNRNMRLGRPRLGERRPTRLPPIRPSLVGALEFRAVLTSLKKSRNIQSLPINLRRYSDDPTFTTAQQQDHMSSISDPAARPPYDVHAVESGSSPTVARPNLDVRAAGGNRLRAVSVNDADGLRLDLSALRRDAVRKADLLGPLNEDNGNLKVPPNNSRRTSEASNRGMPSPTISLSPPSSQPGSRSQSPAPGIRRALSPAHLAPPDPLMPGAQQPSLHPALHKSGSPTRVTRPQAPPKLDIPKPGESSPTSSFPTFRDYPWSTRSGSRPGSLRLVSPSASPQSLFPNEHFPEIEEEEDKPPEWWPNFLPPPWRLVAKLLPTLYSWKEKNIWERLLGIVAAPSVFLLTITLPVVETDKESEEEEERIPDLSLSGSNTPANNRSAPSTITIIGPGNDASATDAAANGRASNGSVDTHGIAGHGNIATVAMSAENLHQHTYHERPPVVLLSPTDRPMLQSPDQIAHRHPPDSSHLKQWDRWLIILQSFTAPFFVVLIIWANTTPYSPYKLLRPTLIGLVCSLSILALILATTTPTRPPRWRVFLCFAGFVVSIAWISTIANEVVGVLKTLGVVLNISDAILGLTIFAVGNSLGDLVADITVARLGFPVMALSACFGGPMLNILLGIGLSGCYMTIKKAETKHDHHPDRPVRFKPYHLDISSTLVVSGATLLVTLLGLLIAVPMRKWKMDRAIGWGLVALWSVSTIGNVAMEVMGFGGDIN